MPQFCSNLKIFQIRTNGSFSHRQIVDITPECSLHTLWLNYLSFFACNTAFLVIFLNRSWDKKCTRDGYVYFTTGGKLRAPQVLHVMITKPIETTSTTDALYRFKLINQCALEHANNKKVRKLGIPFIGTGKYC